MLSSVCDFNSQALTPKTYITGAISSNLGWDSSYCDQNICNSKYDHMPLRFHLITIQLCTSWRVTTLLNKPLIKTSVIKEEVKSSLNSGNVCYHSVHNLSPSDLMSKNRKVKIVKTIILLMVLWESETLSRREELKTEGVWEIGAKVNMRMGDI
jgi:hypothetical protein